MFLHRHSKTDNVAADGAIVPPLNRDDDGDEETKDDGVNVCGAYRVDSEGHYGWCTRVGDRIIADTGSSSTAMWIRLLSADARSYRAATLWVAAERHPWIMGSGGQE